MVVDLHHSPQLPGPLEPLVASVCKSFRAVGPLIVQRAGNAEFTSKQDGSPVTETDIAVEQTIFRDLLTAHPDIPVLGEESGYEDASLPPLCWLIDPIDGTKCFVAGIPGYTSMAVLIHKKTAIAAVIYNPLDDGMYTAITGQGTYRNGIRVQLADIPLPKTAICKERFAAEISTMLVPKGVTCHESPTGGGFGFTQVLDGTAAARFNLKGGGYTHDYAPGGLLVREAGGVLVPIKDTDYHYDTRSFVACHPALADTIREHLPRLRELELAA